LIEKIEDILQHRVRQAYVERGRTGNGERTPAEVWVGGNLGSKPTWDCELVGFVPTIEIDCNEVQLARMCEAFDDGIAAVVKADASTSIRCPGCAYFEQRFCVSSRNDRALFRGKLEVLCHEKDGALFWRDMNVTAAARLTAEMSPFNGFGAALPLKKSSKPRSDSKPTDHSHALFPCSRTLLLCPGGRARSLLARH
jgi:hypothetical protein